MYKFSNGILRLYMLLAFILGVILYLRIFSKLIIKISVTIINCMKKIISILYKVIFTPINWIFKFLDKIMLKPTIKILKNLYIFMTKNMKKLKNLFKLEKIVKKHN